MQNLVFTQLSVSEVRQMIREELQAFFIDKRNVEAMCGILNLASTDKNETIIEDLNMSRRLYNGLKQHKVSTLGEMKNMTWKRFVRVRGIGKVAWDEMQTIVNTVR